MRMRGAVEVGAVTMKTYRLRVRNLETGSAIDFRIMAKDLDAAWAKVNQKYDEDRSAFVAADEDGETLDLQEMTPRA